MSEFNLRALIREVADTSTIADPDTLAKEVASRIGRNHVRAALEQALPSLVQAMLSRQRGSFIVPGDQMRVGPQGLDVAGAPTSNRSRKVQGIRSMWAAQLRERICVGPKSYKFFGDCDADDLNSAASVREDHARQNAANAARLREIADLLTKHGVDTVRELPDSILGAALSDAA